MFFQVVESTSWILGMGLMFGLSFIMSVLTSKDIDGFFVFLPIFAGFVVWAGLLPLWVLVMSIIILVLLLSSKVRRRTM